MEVLLGLKTGCIVKVVYGTALHVFSNPGMLFSKDSIDSESTLSLAMCKLGGRALLPGRSKMLMWNCLFCSIFQIDLKAMALIDKYHILKDKQNKTKNM